MDTKWFEQMHQEGIISDLSYAKIKSKQEQKIISVHWEIKTLLYLGVALLTTGLGILVYKNIDTIGHQVILIFIALICLVSFYYCFKFKLPFSTGKVAAPNAFFDYLLLLACCTFITFFAYLQYQYNLFGNNYGLAVFFPMLLLFFTAYYFDHLGILSMAIANLATWLGLTVTPRQIFTANNFNSETIIFTGLGLGLLLLLLAFESNRRNIKTHFEFTYGNFGTHIILISCLAAMFHFDAVYLLWFLFTIGMVYFFYRKALLDRSFYFMLVITVYFYIGLSYMVMKILQSISSIGMAPLYFGFLYFIFSGFGLVLFLININKRIKKHDSI